MRHRTWARGQARKREARPSPEPLPPGEGRGGTAAMGKSNGQGGGAARSAQREDTAPQDVQHFPVAVGDRRSPDGQARSAWPNKGRGRLACPNPPLRLDRRASRGDLAILKEAAVGLCRSCRKPHPVAHRLTLDPYGLAYSLLRSRAFTPKVVPGARLDNRRRALRQRSRPSGTRWAGQGAQDRCAGGWLGTRHSTVQRSRAHRPDQLGWRPVLPAGTGGAARRGRPDWSEEQRRNLQQHAKSNKHQDDVPEAPFRFFLGGITNLVPNYSTKLTMRK